MGLPPSNPLIFNITADNKYLTYVKWTVADVGTAGAKVVGKYSPWGNSTQVQSASAVGHEPDVAKHAWETNKAKSGFSTAARVCGSCGNCEKGTGIADLSLTARPGSGYKTIELSQLYENALCGEQCNSKDAIFFSGMEYQCAEPTCADTDLAQEGQQAYACGAPQEWVNNDNAAGSKTLSQAACCLKATCGDVSPITKPGQAFQCSSDFEFDASLSTRTSPSQEICCKPKTCASLFPITKPGVAFSCPDYTEFEPARAGVSPPTTSNCCKVATCGDVSPISNPGQRFPCPALTEFHPERLSAFPPGVASCCVPATCADIEPVTNPGLTFAAKCPALTEFDPTRATASPSVTNCCKNATCSDVTPVSKPGQIFTCPDTTELNKNFLDAVPSISSCCLAQTCGDTNPASKPLTLFSCPAGTEFDHQASAKAPPSANSCCKVATCSDITPASKPGKSISCPSGMRFNMSAANEKQPAVSTCCVQWTPTCGDTIATAAGVKFDCASIAGPDWLFKENATDVAAIYTQDYEKCCYKGEVTTNHAANVYVHSAVKPAFPRPVGTSYLFTITVGLNNLVLARSVQLDVQLPAGLQLTEYIPDITDSLQACESSSQSVKCTWPELGIDDVKIITIEAKSVQAGTWEAVAAVTSGEDDLDSVNNRAGVSVAVKWTVYDVGTGGATITGTYDPSTGLGPVVNNYTWNPEPANVGDECGACTNCTEGFGIKPLSVSAQDGVGFRSFDLSQAIDAPYCGQSCFDVDGSYWTGMTYSCVEDCVNVPASTIDLAITKVASSSTGVVQDALITFTLRVTANALSGRVDTLQNVQVTDTVPAGLQIQGIIENPDDRACSTNVAANSFTCTWASYPINATKTIQVTTRAVVAGSYTNCAEVDFQETPTLVDADPTNNRACATVDIKGACCVVTPTSANCTNQLARNCPYLRGANRNQTFTANLPCIRVFCVLASLVDARMLESKSETICVPPWLTCNPRNNTCCPGYTCQYTWKGCSVGEYVCKPAQTCVPQGRSCGGKRGGLCCNGLYCAWDYRSRQGICRPHRPTCANDGYRCRADNDCCPGCRCYSDARCKKITYSMCIRPCRDYSCYVERKKDWDCFFASVAGKWRR
eukprot:gene12044-12187_t